MKDAKNFWDKLSRKYDNQVKKYELTYQKTIEKTNKYLGKDDVVLDYACGTGITTVALAGKVNKICAIDISPKMIEVAKSKADEKKISNIEFSQTDIFNDSLRKGSFNVVLAFNILYFLKDIPETVQRINDLLIPGGYFISTTDCLGEHKKIISVLSFCLSKIGIFPHMQMLKMSELENIIKQGHFEIIETENLYENPPNYYIAAKKK